jgi:hypothetical protein
MHPIIRKWCLGIAAGAFALVAMNVPTYAEEPQSLGPVGVNEPILTNVGSKRVIAFYEADGGQCGMHIVVWDRADVSGGSAARFRVTLAPREVVHVDTPEHQSLNLQCGDSANTLAIVDATKFITAGAAE